MQNSTSPADVTYVMYTLYFYVSVSDSPIQASTTTYEAILLCVAATTLIKMGKVKIRG